jgi:glycosyltransferase involved in cell wall biosynthesis
MTADAAPARAEAVPVSVVVPVLNEEQNLPDALASVSWADEVFVVDSGSADRTIDVARAAGREVVQFDYAGRGPKKKEWALRTLPFRNEWVLLLDADERVPEALRDEIAAAVTDRDRVGYFIDRELVFMGRRLRCFGHNWNMRLFVVGRGRFEDLGLGALPGTGDNEIHEHVMVDGPTGMLRTPLLHDDYRGLTPWLERHNKYATWEAHFYRQLRREPLAPAELLRYRRLDPVRRKRALRRVWVRLPFRPLLRFLVWYVLRRGFRDGYPGYVYSRLMAYYEFIIGAKLAELERGRA